MKNIVVSFLAILFLSACSPSTVLNEISPEEQAFLDSGSAKAIEKESDLWKHIENEKGSFSMRIPHNVGLNGEEGEYELAVSVEKLEDMAEQAPLGFDQATAKQNQELLEKGEYGQDVDWPFEGSKKVCDLGKINAQDFTIFSRFEICDVTLERTLYFINNENQIRLNLIFPRDEKFAELVPEFFTTNEENCGDALIWNFEKQGEFYEMLVQGDAPEKIQDWFDTFDKIVKTIEF